MKRADTYPKEVPKMNALCANCGKVWGVHGAYDGQCPKGESSK
jgi:hypothetical protein